MVPGTEKRQRGCLDDLRLYREGGGGETIGLKDHRSNSNGKNSPMRNKSQAPSLSLSPRLCEEFLLENRIVFLASLHLQLAVWQHILHLTVPSNHLKID